MSVNAVDYEKLIRVCRELPIRELSLFGSVLRSDFGPKSDIDVLVEFDPEAHVGLIEFVSIRNRLSRVLGRKVDLVTKNSLSEPIKEEVSKNRKVVYVQA